MSEEIDRLREVFIASNADDFEPALAMLAEDVELQRAGGMGTIRGKAAIREFLAPDAFEYQRLRPTKFRQRGDKILAFVDVDARGRGSGVELKTKAFLVYTMRNGKATRLEVYFEERGALEAAGLSE